LFYYYLISVLGWEPINLKVHGMMSQWMRLTISSNSYKRKEQHIFMHTVRQARRAHIGFRQQQLSKTAHHYSWNMYGPNKGKKEKKLSRAFDSPHSRESYLGRFLLELG